MSTSTWENKKKIKMLLQSLLGRIHSFHPTGTSENMLIATSVFVIGFYVRWEKPDVGSSFLLDFSLTLNYVVCHPQIVTLLALIGAVLLHHCAAF
jgi:hypothetical protein